MLGAGVATPQGRLGLWPWGGLEDLPAFSAPPPPCQGGCISKLETFIQEHLRIIGAVGIGIACVQVWAGGQGAVGGCRDVRRLVAVARSCQLCATGLWYDLHVLPVQEPEAGALLTCTVLALRARCSFSPPPV